MSTSAERKAAGQTHARGFGAARASLRPTPNYTGCSYVAIVDAASGSLLTN
jgi:hypothetical protein